MAWPFGYPALPHISSQHTRSKTQAPTSLAPHSIYHVICIMQLLKTGI